MAPDNDPGDGEDDLDLLIYGIVAVILLVVLGLVAWVTSTAQGE